MRYMVEPLEGVELMDWYALRDNRARWDSLEASARYFYALDTDGVKQSAALPSDCWPSAAVRRKYINRAKAARKEARKRPYLIQDHGAYWSVQKLNNEGDCYTWLCPSAGHCRNEAAAIEWMMADVECRDPDYGLIWGEDRGAGIRYFCDPEGRKVRDGAPIAHPNEQG